MTEKTTTGTAAPPYDQNPPYTTIPAQHQEYNAYPGQPTYNHTGTPGSPPPQHDPNAYPMPQAPQYTHDPNAIQHQATGQPIGSPPGFNEQQKGSYYGQGQQGQTQTPMSPGEGGHGIPMQSPQGGAQVGGGQMYHTAMPLQNLTEGAAPVDCPACRQRALTRTEYVSGNTTMAWAAVVCCVCWLGCIPFMMRSLKDVEHHCGKCGVLLATWHNSGRTVVHQHS